MDTLMPKPLKQQMPSQFFLYKEIPTHHSSLPSPYHFLPLFSYLTFHHFTIF